MAAPLHAQEATEAARTAARELERASVQLDRAKDARDRVAALTDTVRAYETGLAAMRDGLRAATIREIELNRDLQSREAEVAQLLGVLQAISDSAGPKQLVHPGGPVGAARTAMMVSSVTPGLAQRAADLRADVTEITELRRVQEEAADRLRQGLQEVQEARTTLSQALADRTDLPTRFTADPVRMAILLSASETLEQFAGQIDQLAESEQPVDLPPISDRKGRLAFPVQGELIRAAGEADAAGVVRPGILVATREKALVTSPTAATIRYVGPFLDYGLVSILEPEPDLLFVFAGLETGYGTAGQVIPEGSPVGLMGGADDEPDDLQSQSVDRGGAERPETLYIEVRQGDTPVDPLEWFGSDKE
ncbi:murein hydrolase activator EnvC family protein [Pseudoprimorskyibacter insulae]|nr:peptidase M23 [Pseudoprimorskyibacter insulae]